MVTDFDFKMAGATRLELATFPHEMRDVLNQTEWCLRFLN